MIDFQISDHENRLKRLESWIQAATDRNLVQRVEKLEAEQDRFLPILKRLILKVFGSD